MIRYLDLTPIESAASRLETLQRLFACYALVMLGTLAHLLPDLANSDQPALLQHVFPQKIQPAVQAAVSHPTTYLRTLALGHIIALIILLIVAMSSNRWVLRLFAVIAAVVFGIAFLWSAFMLDVVLIGVIGGEAAETYDLTASDYVITLLLRIFWATTAGALLANAALALLDLTTRPSEDLALMRTVGSGRWLSLRRFFAVFDIPQMLALPMAGRLWRVIGVFVGLAISSIGVLLWMWAPLIIMLGDFATILSCSDNASDPVLICAAFSDAINLKEPLLSYIVFPAASVLVGSFVINIVKYFTRSPRPSSTAPLLFLRSFADDQARLKAHRGSLLTFLMDFGRSPDGVDQLLVYEFVHRAPVIALGRPGERRPPFGAQRVYTDDASWRDHIRVLFDSSRAIILVMDQSIGLRWEIDEVARRPDLLAKTLFLMRKTSDFDLFRTKLAIDDTCVQANSKQMVVGAYRSKNEWVILKSRRPTRITYQIATRQYFQTRPS